MLVDQTNAAGGIHGRKVAAHRRGRRRRSDAGGAGGAAAGRRGRHRGHRRVQLDRDRARLADLQRSRHPADHALLDRGAADAEGLPALLPRLLPDDRQGLFAAEVHDARCSARSASASCTTTRPTRRGWRSRRAAAAEELGLHDRLLRRDQSGRQGLHADSDPHRRAKLDAVFFTGYHSQVGLLLKQSREMGLTIKWIAGDACNNPVMVEIAGVANAAGALLRHRAAAQGPRLPGGAQVHRRLHRALRRGPGEHLDADGGRGVRRDPPRDRETRIGRSGRARRPTCTTSLKDLNGHHRPDRRLRREGGPARHDPPRLSDRRERGSSC